MISFIKGNIKHKAETYIILFCNGIGWHVNFIDTTLIKEEEGDDLELYTHTQYSEHDQTLWGFLSFDDLKIFKLLISVSGVGPKSAQSLIAKKGIQSIIRSIESDDQKSLNVYGIGPKTSIKIIIELKDKIRDYKYLEGTLSDNILLQKGHKQIFEDAKIALEQLGYNRSIVESKLDEFRSRLDVDSIDKLTIESILRELLKNL